MHQQAEFGLAAHWSYKESHRTASSLGWISGHKEADISVPTTDKVCMHPLQNTCLHQDSWEAYVADMDALSAHQAQLYHEELGVP